MIMAPKDCDFPEVIDSTIRGAFVACEHQAYLQYFHHYKPATISVDLHAGAVYAVGLEVARMAYWGANATQEQALALATRKMIEAWGDYEPPEGHVKTLDRMLGALIYYFDVFGWKTDHMQPYMLDGKPAVEFSFTLPIPGTRHPTTGAPVLYTGRFDMLGLYNNQLFVEDDKTTKQLGPTWGKNWTHRSQFTGYCWGAREFGHPVAGAIIRGISILKTKYGHAESLQFRPDWMIQRWLEQLRRDVDRMVECWKTGYWSYDLDTACTHYGGCMFQDTCSQQNEQKVLDNYFVQRVWDPVKREERDFVKQT